MSVGRAGMQGNGNSRGAAISADGRHVAFDSEATDLVAEDTNVASDIFVRDRLAGTTERVSVASGGSQGNGGSYAAVVSGDGRCVLFGSGATNLVSGDLNGRLDIFVRDRDATGFTSLCDPGVGGVIACPCSNPPSGPGRGCDNSAATGGAILAASGIAYLSMDSLVFTTSGERPTALSVVTQWTGSSTTGAFFGQGVRCSSGTFKRLYTKSAVAGSLTAPDLGAGDPSVSARAAALGDPLSGGSSRWHFVHYRDPSVLGACPATSTFNATQTGQVTWSP